MAWNDPDRFVYRNFVLAFLGGRKIVNIGAIGFLKSHHNPTIFSKPRT